MVSLSKPRKIPTRKTSPPLFVPRSGTLGRPGFARVLRVGDELQVSALRGSVDEGITQAVFGMTDYPLTQQQGSAP